MSDSDLHTLTGAYAVNAVSAKERKDFEDHQHECDSCAEEVRELVATTARLAAAVAEPAPQHLRERVLDEIQRTRQISPLHATVPLQQARRPDNQRRWFQQPLGVAASLLAVLCVGLGALAVEADQRADRLGALAVEADQRADRAARIAAVATDPDARTLTGTAASGVSAKVVTANRQGVFSARALPELPPDRDYQLWVIGEDGKGSARPVGVLDLGSDGTAEQLVSDLDVGDSVGLTVEPRGGSKQPTTAPLMVMRLTA
jgi:anti-sigma-K factor RskA